MAVRSLTYLDIPVAKRQESAARILSRFRERINDPLTTPEQAGQIAEQIAKLEHWVRGTIPTEGP